MSLYNGPPRGGTRGGADQFSWDSVKADKDREYYLGHSVKALTGRWQKGMLPTLYCSHELVLSQFRRCLSIDNFEKQSAGLASACMPISGKDVYWYTREKGEGGDTAAAAELHAVKQREEELMAEVCQPMLRY